MDKELVKLSKLCEHWAEHNISHKESISKWRDIVKEKGLEYIAENLSRAMEMIDKCNEFLITAAKEVIKD
jgi:predicted phosphohydrolase